LAVEYADTGQDERDLQKRFAPCWGAGTRYVWFVRLTRPRRVKVYEPDAPHYSAYPGQQLEAPGILANPVPVEALYDPAAAREVALRNLLQHRGYADLEAVQKEGGEEGRQEGREEGRKTGQLALVLHQLQRAIVQTPESDSQRIRRLDGDGLVALAEALLDFRAKSDLTAWLERHV